MELLHDLVIIKKKKRDELRTTSGILIAEEGDAMESYQKGEIVLLNQKSKFKKGADVLFKSAMFDPIFIEEGEIEYDKVNEELLIGSENAIQIIL